MLAYLEKSLNSGKGGQNMLERGDKGEQNKDAGKESTNTESSEMLRARLCLVNILELFILSSYLAR